MSEGLSFKIVGGEEIVASVIKTLHANGVDNTPTGWVVRRPHILRFQPVAPGQVGLAFVPWTLSNPEIDRIEIPASAVLLTFAPSDNVEKQYLEQTTRLTLNY